MVRFVQTIPKMYCFSLVLTILSVITVKSFPYSVYSEYETECPRVRAMLNLDLERLKGKWFIIQYYASSEEDLTYKCMKSTFSIDHNVFDVTMNFTYIFLNDPTNDVIVGNITWNIPVMGNPAHWIHTEDPYEGDYNTYILDTNYDEWALLLHCAEKASSPRYFSSFIMGREATLGHNVISYLRDKLPSYSIDMSYLFDIAQDDCNY